MSTTALILRTNRTLTKRVVPDKEDDFSFEGGTYFIHKDKVFLWKNLRGKIRPTLLYMEGIAEPLYLDNLKIKQYFKLLPVIDPKTKKPVCIDKDNKPILNPDGSYKVDESGHPTLIKTPVKELQDIFIDSRSIHNMTDRKILHELSATDPIGITDIILMILVIVGIVIGVVNIFIH